MRSTSRWHSIERRRCLAIMAMTMACGSAVAAEETWRVIGRQGIVKLVWVPTDQAADRKAYDGQIARLCSPDQTCFLNFYTNTSGMEIGVPLPEEISNQATATFRRSVKQGGEMFMWSCRMKASTGECF